MTKGKKEDLENRILSYSTLKNINEKLGEQPWNPNIREYLGQLRANDPGYYVEAGPDAVIGAANLEQEKAKKEIEETVFYSDLINAYNNEELKQILSSLPPLKNGSNKKLAKAHKALYEELYAWKTGMEFMKKDPEQYKRQVSANAKDEADAYFARGRDESTRRVAYGRVLEAKRNLYQVIDKIKPSKKNYKKK